MTEMIERLARAMATRRAQDPDQRVYPDACTPQGETVAAWELYVPDVRLVIAGMREPTEAMVEAGAPMVRRYDSRFENGSDTAEETWEAMIDAALGEGS